MCIPTIEIGEPLEVQKLLHSKDIWCIAPVPLLTKLLIDCVRLPLLDKRLYLTNVPDKKGKLRHVTSWRSKDWAT